ncbi:molybdopterin-binding protein, partial [Nocardioides sp.]
IRRAGEDVAAGEVALRAGARLGPAQLGLLAAVGRPTVSLRPRPRIAVISTGAELVDPAKGHTLRPEGARSAVGAVADSNTATLAAAAHAAGAEVSSYGPVTDDAVAFRDVLAAAAESTDLVVTTGGISAGDHDVVKAALHDVEGFWFGPVAIRPGRPQGVGTVTTADRRRVPVVTLPGTPVAAYSSFLLFVLPALRALAGGPP